MRALVARLLPLLAAGCCAPSPPPLLLLLRAACPARDPALFVMGALRAQATLAGRGDELGAARLLGYDETCGSTWRDNMWAVALSTLSAGGAVAGAGWPGARVCALLGGAGSRPPAACAAPLSRAAVLPLLCARLRWRRALLPPPAGAAPCSAAVRAAAAALSAAGVAVTRAPLRAAVADSDFDVVIACGASDTIDESYLAHIAVLLLHIADDEKEWAEHDTTFDTSNTTIKRKTIYDVLDANATTMWSSSAARVSGPPRLLLSDTLLGAAPPPLAALYARLLDAVDAASTNSSLPIHAVYHLYEQVTPALIWQPVVSFSTTASRSFDDDWNVTARPTGDEALWRSWRTQDEHSGNGVFVATVVCGVSLGLFVLGGLVALARAVARARRGRRRRADAVLAPQDFTFPADEPRRLPDGMETMLSCWLQQLHEFGGPELERPDLLKRPAPPSAPSSTASGSRLALDRRTRYKGDAVHLKLLPLGLGVPTLELRRKATDVLLVLHSLRHENLNPFIGCLCELRPSLVFDYCGRGSLEDVLMADEIKLDWTFRLSLLTDLVKGLRYLHASSLRVHGRLSSRNCVVDSRWVLRLTDYGLPDFYRVQGLSPPPRSARDRLWTAPELLRAGEEARGSQPGDVFSFAIIMQEVIVRGEPYCMLALSPDEIVEKLCRPPPLIRPSVSIGAAPPEAVSVMRQCWAELPDMRPTTDALLDIFRLLHRGRKINIVDSMFEMLEKYSNNLEELIKERTEQLDMEKKKTEQLLNRMLPKSVADRLVLGQRVEPEEFEEVSIYFSDIVGFTALAARSTPVQVVALLNDLYTTFDAAIQQYRVYKVETIGDAYMVVGGLPVRARDHAESVATMALHLLHLAGRFRVRHLPHTPLHLRIGLHSGPCCAGVVGLTMPRYCLFGDTVNTASRMESTGAAWRIQVSAATAARLEAAGGYRLRSRGLTQVKGKGAMHTYWLLGKDGFDKPLPSPPPLPTEEPLLENDAESEPEFKAGDDELEHVPLSQHQDKFAWQRSGAVSADSSPPAAPYERYRCRGGGRALRRQWSLERGEALAAARALSPPIAGVAGAAAGGAGSAAGEGVRAAGRTSRYRTRPDPEAPTPSASFD